MTVTLGSGVELSVMVGNRGREGLGETELLMLGVTDTVMEAKGGGTRLPLGEGVAVLERDKVWEGEAVTVAFGTHFHPRILRNFDFAILHRCNLQPSMILLCTEQERKVFKR